MNRLASLIAAVALLAICSCARGMAEERIGPDKPDRPTIAQPGWPKGIEQLLRDRCRVYSIWVNGNEQFYFKATADEVNQLLAQFSAARLRDHEVKLESGRPKVTSLDKHEYEYNVKLKVLSGIALFVTRQETDDQTLEPVLTIYLDEESALAKQLKLPQNVIVTGAVNVPGLNSKGALPRRTASYGRVQFGNGGAMGIDDGISTRITMWEKDAADGIELAEVARDGSFKVALSADEVAAMQAGNLWLTATAGNALTAAKNDDPKVPISLLSQDKNKAQALKLAAPTYYYGRIVFEDGTPAVLDSKPWPGAEIFVDFPYCGMAKLDAEGYFRVHLEVDQLAQLVKQKPRKNIYIPNKESGSSTARETFASALLSKDKARAGVVKLRKPSYRPATRAQAQH